MLSDGDLVTIGIFVNGTTKKLTKDEEFITQRKFGKKKIYSYLGNILLRKMILSSCRKNSEARSYEMGLNLISQDYI